MKPGWGQFFVTQRGQFRMAFDTGFAPGPHRPCKNVPKERLVGKQAGWCSRIDDVDGGPGLSLDLATGRAAATVPHLCLWITSALSSAGGRSYNSTIADRAPDRAKRITQFQGADILILLIKSFHRRDRNKSHIFSPVRGARRDAAMSVKMINCPDCGLALRVADSRAFSARQKIGAPAPWRPRLLLLLAGPRP